MTNVSNSTLLSKARSFMGKSAVIAIAPLAMVEVAHSATTFGVPGNPSGSGSGFASGGVSFNQTNYSTSALPEFNSVIGVLISVSGSFSSPSGSGDGTFVLSLGSGSINEPALESNVIIPVSYNFTLSTNGNSTISWVLDFGLGPSSTEPSGVGGEDYGTHIGQVNLITGASALVYSPTLTISVSQFGEGEILMVDMTGAGHGVSLNAVPEPSTSALWVGSSIFALLAGRRRPLRQVR